MPRLTVQQTVAKWQANATSVQAQTYYKNGITNPSKDWATNTEAAESAWQAGVQRAIQMGTRVAGVRAAGTSFWQKQTLAKISNWATGINASASAGGKAQAGFQRLFGYLGQAESAIANMSANTRAERIARSAAFLTAMGEAKDSDTTRV